MALSIFPANETRPLPEKVVGFFDIGTNSIRLILVRFHADRTFEVVAEQKRTVRLGEGEFRTGRITSEAERRAGRVVTELAALARAEGAHEIVAIATAAIREAVNGKKIVETLNECAKTHVRVVSGLEEARLIYLGISRNVEVGNRPTLFIDIGGGSTETIVGDETQFQFLDSIGLGAIRLAGMFFPNDYSKKVSPEMYAKLQHFVRRYSVRTMQQLQTFRINQVIASSGTARNLVEVTIRRVNNRESRPSDFVTTPQLQETISHLCSLRLDKRRQVPGLNPDRADIIIAGGAILETILTDLGVKSFRTTNRGLRDGLPIDFLSRIEDAGFDHEGSVRSQSVLGLVRRYLVDELRARQRAKFVVQLFDMLREIGLHSLGNTERGHLQFAAMLNTIGEFVSRYDFPRHTSYLIRNSLLLGFDSLELDLLAKLVEGTDDSRKAVRMMTAILQIATTFDLSCNRLPTRARFVRINADAVALVVNSGHAFELEPLDIDRLRLSFRKAFKMELIITQGKAPA